MQDCLGQWFIKGQAGFGSSSISEWWYHSPQQSPWHLVVQERKFSPYKIHALCSTATKHTMIPTGGLISCTFRAWHEQSPFLKTCASMLSMFPKPQRLKLQLESESTKSYHWPWAGEVVGVAGEPWEYRNRFQRHRIFLWEWAHLRWKFPNNGRQFLGTLCYWHLQEARVAQCRHSHVHACHAST